MITPAIDGLLIAGARPALLLLHGAAASHLALAPLAPLLPGPELIIPSLPGRLGSLGPPLSTVAALAAWAAALVRQLGHHQIVVAGHSLGGAIALELALSEPDLVCGLALIASGARLRVLPEILAATTNEPAASDWRACDTFDRLSSLAAVHVPTRIIHGTNDPLTPPKYQDWLVANITGAKRDAIVGAGHDVVGERPLEVANALGALWSRFAP